MGFAGYRYVWNVKRRDKNPNCVIIINIIIIVIFLLLSLLMMTIIVYHFNFIAYKALRKGPKTKILLHENLNT